LFHLLPVDILKFEKIVFEREDQVNFTNTDLLIG